MKSFKVIVTIPLRSCSDRLLWQDWYETKMPDWASPMEGQKCVQHCEDEIIDSKCVAHVIGRSELLVTADCLSKALARVERFVWTKFRDGRIMVRSDLSWREQITQIKTRR